MNAEDYIAGHWDVKNVWRNLDNPKHVTRLAKCASLVEGSEFVDVGCALGHSTVAMSKRRPGRWAGLDFSALAIQKAAVLFPSGEWLCAEGVSDLASIEGKFDSVVCSEVLEHVEDDDAFSRAVLRIPRLRAIFTTPVKAVRDPGHLRLYSQRDLERMFSAGRFPWIERAEVRIEGPFFFVVVDVDRAALVRYDRLGVGGRNGL